ncbi:MAG: phosphoribosylanthranilate isomerase [bacterium]
MLTIKICGLTTLDDARFAVEQGATYLGFVLYRQSPRCVTPKHLRRIVSKLPRGVRAVGVFVNEDPETVRQVVEDCGLFAIQLHGDESPEKFAGMPVPLWRAVRWVEGQWVPNPALWSPELFVMDAASAAYGGSGLALDWNVAAGFAAQHRALLAGGLTPENVAEAIEKVRPVGVDVSSGVEVSPGRKDHRKILEFIHAARKADKKLA